MAPYTEPIAPTAPRGSEEDVRSLESRLLDRLDVEIRALADAVDALAAALGHADGTAIEPRINHTHLETQEQA